jgi:hypothetical protein
VGTTRSTGAKGLGLPNPAVANCMPKWNLLITRRSKARKPLASAPPIGPIASSKEIEKGCEQQGNKGWWLSCREWMILGEAPEPRHPEALEIKFGGRHGGDSLGRSSYVESGRAAPRKPYAWEFPARLGAVYRRTRKPQIGLSLQEARLVLVALHCGVVQDQVKAYDAYWCPCRECGRYRRIKDWRPRVFDTSLGTIRVNGSAGLACPCEPEQIDEDGEIAEYRETLPYREPAVRRLSGGVVPVRLNWGSLPYRGAAARVSVSCAGRGSCRTCAFAGRR